MSLEETKRLVSVAYSKYYSLRELGEMFGVSRSSVCRALERAESMGLAPILI